MAFIKDRFSLQLSMYSTYMFNSSYSLLSTLNSLREETSLFLLSVNQSDEVEGLVFGNDCALF